MMSVLSNILQLLILLLLMLMLLILLLLMLILLMMTVCFVKSDSTAHLHPTIALVALTCLRLDLNTS